MNKKGQSSGIPALSIAFMVAVFIFLIGMTVVNLIKPMVTLARSVDNLDCSSDTISDGNKLACLIVDLTIPYFMVIILASAGGLITYRLML